MDPARRRTLPHGADQDHHITKKLIRIREFHIDYVGHAQRNTRLETVRTSGDWLAENDVVRLKCSGLTLEIGDSIACLNNENHRN
jgi:hypothetical protein